MIDVRTTPAPIETVTPIKPSEAIRLGCLIAPVQFFGDWASRDGEACAAGAMNLGWGRLTDDDLWLNDDDDPAVRVPRFIGCPDGCSTYLGGFGSGVVPHLNDYHRWSRERIADWLEGLGL